MSFCLRWVVVELFERVSRALISPFSSLTSHLGSLSRSPLSYSIRCTSHSVFSRQRLSKVSAHQMLCTWRSLHEKSVKYSRYSQSWSYHREPQLAATHSSSDSRDFWWVCALIVPESLMKACSSLLSLSCSFRLVIKQSMLYFSLKSENGSKPQTNR